MTGIQCKASIILIPKPDEDNTKKKKKKKLQDNVTDEHAGKCPLKILTNIKYISCVKLEFYLVDLFKGE